MFLTWSNCCCFWMCKQHPIICGMPKWRETDYGLEVEVEVDVGCSAKWIKVSMGFTAFSKHLLTHNAIEDKRNSVLGIHCANDIHDYLTVPWLLLLSLLLLSSFFIIIIIIIIFTMCHFNEYAGFTWFSCHTGFVPLLLDGCYGRWFVYVKQGPFSISVLERA